MLCKHRVGSETCLCRGLHSTFLKTFAISLVDIGGLICTDPVDDLALGLLWSRLVGLQPPLLSLRHRLGVFALALVVVLVFTGHGIGGAV